MVLPLNWVTTMKLFFSGTLKSWLRLPRTKNDVFFNRDFIYILYMYVPVNRPLCMTGKKKIIELKFLLLFSCCPQLSANKIDLFINRNFRDTMCTNYPLIFCRIRTMISSFFFFFFLSLRSSLSKTSPLLLFLLLDDLFPEEFPLLNTLKIPTPPQ